MKPGDEDNATGSVKFDDRGNAVWEWSPIAADDIGPEITQERVMLQLECPDLALEDDGPTPAEEAAAVRYNPLGVKKGYDPYDSGKLGKSAATRRRDLRKLSEWLKLKKQASGNKDDDS